MPKITPSIQANKDGSLSIGYHPVEKGVHEVNLTYNDQQAEGLPFRCYVDNFDKCFVTAYGPGLNGAAGGTKAIFYVTGGDHEVKIDGPQTIQLEKKKTGDLTEYGYTPITPGEYKVHITRKGKPIHGSPFPIKVSGEGRKRSQISLAGSSDFRLGGKDVDLTGLEGILKTPSGGSEPILLKKFPDGALGISSFAPKRAGSYTVEVTQDGKKYSGSPFSIKVGDREVCAANKVKATGATSNAEANKWNNITLDYSVAGHGNISFSIEGSHRSDIEHKESAPNQYQISYKPHEPGIYLMNIRFGHDNIPGSPFMVNAAGKPSGRIRETVSKSIGEAQPTGIGSKCDFQLKIPGTDPLDMEAVLTFPSGKSDLCEIKDMPHSLYDIRFTPEEEGVHTVSLKHKGIHIAGSPFQYTVGKSPCGGSHKVEIGGPGLERGEVGSNNEFNIYTREAGAGTLSVSVEGPSKAELDVVDRGSGYTTVAYKVTEPGDYGIHVKYNDEHVPDSPSFVYIVPESGDAKMCTVHGIKDRGLQIDRPVSFTMSLNGARPENPPRAFVETPASTEEDVFIQELDQDTYALRFIPKENGVHYVHVKVNEAHIPGSPFPMLVGKMGADPALVLANGDGLEKGEAGKAARFFVTTTNAGTGTLGVTIEGPSKCAIVCTEGDEGYEFAYTPMAPGDYLILIKFCNITIAGCPTKAKVTGSGKKSDVTETSGLAVETVEKKEGAKKQKKFTGDASKVTAKGAGLKKAFMNRPAQFNVDVKDAGNALLTVAMISSNGRPAGELSYKKTRGTVYQVTFKAEEKGEHNLFIRWGTDDIPGSPFPIEIN